MRKSLSFLFVIAAILSFSACRSADENNTYSSEADYDSSYGEEVTSKQIMPDGGDDGPGLGDAHDVDSGEVTSEEIMPEWDSAARAEEEDVQAVSADIPTAEGCNKASKAPDLPFGSVVMFTVNDGNGEKREAWEVVMAPHHAPFDDSEIPCELIVRLRRGADSKVMTAGSVVGSASEIVRPRDPGHEAARQMVDGTVPAGGM